MSLTQQEVHRVALLARLALTPEEEATFATQLGQILEAFEKLDSLDVSAIEATAHVVEVEDAFRDDEVTNPPATESLRRNAPAADGAHFRVPKIIE